MTRTDRLILGATVGLIVGVVLALCVADPRAFRLFFAWPDGGVWSNLLASFLLGGPAVLAIFHRLARHHEAMRQLAQQHHNEVMAKIGETQ